jgi:cytosine deaminase
MDTPYFQDVQDRTRAYGGFFNAHLHLDRAGTFHATVDMLREVGVMHESSLSLSRKHAIIPLVHASDCYDPEALYSRVERFVRTMVDVGTARADTVVDTTCDRVGLTALETFAKLREDYAQHIDLRIGAYSPLGFRDDQPERWALLETGAQIADFIGLLPERDDVADYPEHIGFDESCRRAVALARRLGKQIHIHVDQANHHHESGSELVADMVESMGWAQPHEHEPFIWLIHVISPSAYDEARFARLADKLAALNIGIICCPGAALSMRQYRPFATPTHNSIARVLEFVAAGVQVRLGSDNVCDITSPMGTVNLMDEVRVLGDATRYYDFDFLARLAAGLRPDAAGLKRLKSHLAENETAVQAVVRRLSV